MRRDLATADIAILAALVGAPSLAFDPVLVAGAAGLLLGVSLAGGLVLAIRRARVSRAREVAAADARARAAVEARTLRHARTRASGDPLIDPLASTEGPSLPADRWR